MRRRILTDDDLKHYILDKCGGSEKALEFLETMSSITEKPKRPLRPDKGTSTLAKRVRALAQGVQKVAADKGLTPDQCWRAKRAADDLATLAGGLEFGHWFVNLFTVRKRARGRPTGDRETVAAMASVWWDYLHERPSANLAKGTTDLIPSPFVQFTRKWIGASDYALRLGAKQWRDCRNPS